jgi:hypothetical protein
MKKSTTPKAIMITMSQTLPETPYTPMTQKSRMSGKSTR